MFKEEQEEKEQIEKKQFLLDGKDIERILYLNKDLNKEDCLSLGFFIYALSSESVSKSYSVFLNSLYEDSLERRLKISNILKTSLLDVRFILIDPYNFDEIFKQIFESDREHSPIQIQNLEFKEENGAESIFLAIEEQFSEDEDRLIVDEKKIKEILNIKRELSNIEIIQIMFYMFIKSKGSDLYIEPRSLGYRTRVNIDNIVREFPFKFDKNKGEQLIRSILSVCGKNTNLIHREAVDTSILVRFEDGQNTQDLEFRIHTHPTYQGVSAVLRSQANAIKDFRKTGLLEYQYKLLLETSRLNQGLILITGATGSGKSITLECIYHSLEGENTKKIIEIADTIEFLSNEREQIEVSPFSLSWQDSIVAVLRSKPHVLGIGEIRSQDSLKIAIEASMTGHLVLATFHASNVGITLDRLSQMGVEITRLASSINLIHSQKLLRKLCNNCKIIDEKNSKIFDNEVYTANEKGCIYCNFTGYQGKFALGETLRFNDKIEEALIRREPIRIILESNPENFIPLSLVARLKILDGTTSVKEAVGVLGKDYYSNYLTIDTMHLNPIARTFIKSKEQFARLFNPILGMQAQINQNHEEWPGLLKQREETFRLFQLGDNAKTLRLKKLVKKLRRIAINGTPLEREKAIAKLNILEEKINQGK